MDLKNKSNQKNKMKSKAKYLGIVCLRETNKNNDIKYAIRINNG